MLLASCSNDVSGPGTGGGTSNVAYETEIVAYNNPFSAVCGTRSDDVYAVSDVIFHYNGLTWETIPLPTNRGPFSAAWSPVPGELFVTDEEDLFHYSGGEWSFMDRQGGHITDVWAAGRFDAYATHTDGLLRYSGLSWREVGPPVGGGILYAVTGSGPADVVAVGERGRVVRYDGREWHVVEIDTNTAYLSVARTANGRTFAADRRSTVVEIVDSVAVPVLQDVFDYWPPVVLCEDGHVVYAAGHVSNETVVKRYASGAWTDVAELPSEVTDLWRSRDGDLYATGEDGSVWKNWVPDQPRPGPGGFRSAWGMDGVVFLVGRGAYRFQDGEWTDLGKEYVTANPAYAVHGRDTDDVYAVGSGMILHFDGTQWAWVNGGLGEHLEDVWVGAGDDVVAAGYYSVVEYDGDTWTQTRLSDQGYISSVGGFGDRAWLVGARGFFAERRGDTWHTSEIPGRPDLHEIQVLDATHVYALGDAPSTYYFYDGRTWSERTMDGIWLTPARGIWGTSPSNLYIVDYYGTLAHFDGHAWSELPRILGYQVETIWGLPGGGLVIAGSAGIATYRRR